MRNRNKKSANYWLIRAIIFLVLVIVGIFGFASLKEIRQKKAIENEITSLKKQAERIRQENMQVKEKLAYLSSEDYQKMKAKEKLNLQEPNEKVIILSQGFVKSKKKIIPINQTVQPLAIATESNFQKWWKYFFK